jgi:translation initiation factor 1A
MPNLKGGKNYKKMKHGAGPAKPDLHEIGEGQMIGRVLRLLGDRQASVYCNDGIERHCRIRGKLRKRVWIATGDVVLISLRILGGGDDSDDEDDVISAKDIRDAKKGDILAKYDPEIYGKLKKMDGVNKRLFDGLESINAHPGGSKGFDGHDLGGGDLFDHGDEDEEVGEESSVDSDGEPKKARTPWKRPGAPTATASDDDVNIDAI